MKVAIIGGGIIGLTSAYYLNKAGYDVTVLDKGDLSDGCSHGNAGMIVPSHIIPLAAPGMIAKGIRWMFNSTSPFYVRPRVNFDLLKWGWTFYRHANKMHVAKSIPALKELSLYSKACYQQLVKDLPFDFGYAERGLLMLYQTPETEHEEAETAAIGKRSWSKSTDPSAEEVQSLEPDVRVTVRGGIYFPGDAHLTPQQFMQQLIPYLKKRGVSFVTNSAVNDFSMQGGKIASVITDQSEQTFDEIILATGSWSGSVAAKLGITVPMQAGKGYSFLVNDVEKNIRIPSIFLEARVAVTPMGKNIRFGGTMEITGVDHRISINRVKGIVDAIPKYYPDLKVAMPEVKNIWHGLRPCSPDGLPYIGRSKKIQNLTFATGHAMMGLSLGPGTGKLVADLVTGNSPEVQHLMFDPERFD
ncbi:MAG: amino acid dehydrogenase [Bacteroidetes bacterium OLB12]|nr:MAG: amino acid dehydrogenase [Bacteroidetes bacterium OLB12]